VSGPSYGPGYRGVDVPVDGGSLRVGVWTAPAPDAPTVVAVHGVTANHLAWQRLAALDRFTVVAPDLRGRGRSSHLPGPAGMERHADDLAGVLDHLGLDRPLLTGHSMGGFVAAAFTARHPGRTAGSVLVDGGLPLPPPPPGTSSEEALNATIGPAAQRLTMRFASPEEYLDFWRPHPALAAAWTPEVEAYLRYDLEGDRSCVSLAAVRDDSRGLLDAATVAGWAEVLPAGTPFLRAPYGMLGDEGGLYPAGLVAEHRSRFPQVCVLDVPETNHYTIVMGEPGARAVADALEERLGGSGRMEP
jgi:pimeloyl-ACP methyl ester carboxylesterase